MKRKLDLEPKNILRALKLAPPIQSGFHFKRKHVGKYWHCQRCLSLALAQILNERK